MKSKERIDATGEVFTPLSLVREMLDKLPAELFSDPTKTYLDNSCGNGQFLIEVFRRKLNAYAVPNYTGSNRHDTELRNQCLSTIYGVDLMADNVADTIARLHLYNRRSYDFWTEDAQPKPELLHPAHRDGEDWQFLQDHRTDKKPYQRDYAGISVRFSHFNKGNAGVFEYRFKGEKKWTKCYNIVCCNALEYDYEFDQDVKEFQDDRNNSLVAMGEGLMT